MKKLTTINRSFEPNTDLIERLEIVLQEARSGVIRSMVAVTERFNGACGEFLCISEDTDSIKILGSLSFVHHNILNALSAQNFTSGGKTG